MVSKKNFKYIPAEGFDFTIYEDDGHILDYLPTYELNNDLIMEDPYAVVIPEASDQFDDRNDLLIDELVLSAYGPNGKAKFLIDHLLVTTFGFILLFFSLHVLLLFYTMVFFELILADEEQEADLITFNPDEWLYSESDELRDYYMHNALFSTDAFDLKGNTILGYGEKWGVMPTSYSASIDYWFDTNMKTILLIQDMDYDTGYDMGEIFSDANSESKEFYSDKQKEYSDITDNIKAIYDSPIFNESEDIKYSFYNFNELILNTEKDTYCKIGEPLDKKFINVFNDRFRFKFIYIMCITGVRDFEWSTYSCFLQESNIINKILYNHDDNHKKKDKKNHIQKKKWSQV